MATPKNIAARAAQRLQMEETVWRVPASADDPHYLITWNLPRFIVPVARVRELLEANGLQGVEVAEIRGLSAVRRALAEMASDEVVRQVFNDEEETAFALLRIEQGDKEAKRATLEQGVTVSYLKRPEKGQAAIVYSSPEAERMLAPVIGRYAASYTNQDIQAKVLAAVLNQLSAIAFRERGGVYLIPAGATETVKKLRAFVADLSRETGEDCHLSTLAIVNTQEAREDIRYHGYQTLVSDLKVMRTRLKDMLAPRRVNEAGYTSVKPDTVARYLDECNNLGKRAALYRDVAELGLSELNEALGALRNAYEAVKAGLSAEEFAFTLNGVEKALSKAERGRPHGIVTAEDAADPFAADAPLVGSHPASAARQVGATDGATDGAEAEEVDPFAADAPDL